MAKYKYNKYKSEWYINGVLIDSTLKTEVNSGVWSSYVYRIVYSDKTLGNTNIQFNNLLNGELYIYHQSTNINDAIDKWNSGGETYACYKINGKVYSYGPNQPMGSFLSKSLVEKQKSSFIEEIIAEDGTYPNDGLHSDGFYYVKDRKANEILVYEGASQVNRYNKYISEIWITKDANSFHNYLTASTNSSYYNSVNLTSVPSTVYEVEINSSGNLIRTNSVSRNDMIINKLYANSSSSSSINLYVRTATNTWRRLENSNGTLFTFNTNIKIEKILDSVVEGDFQEGYYNGYFYEKLENKLFTEIKEVWYVDENSQLQRVDDWMVVDEDFLQAQSNEMFLTLDDYKYLMLNDGLDEDTTYHILGE